MKEKKKLLETFKVFSLFCEKHKLTYFAAYGTAIGAVRHHGVIPWDDDIDVHMLRKDYDRMLELKDTLPAPYRIDEITKNYTYTALFAKFMDTSTSIWEQEHIPYMLGVYIDIFPLDDCPNTDDILNKKIKLNNVFDCYLNSLNEWSFKDVLLRLVKGHPIAFLNKLKIMLIESKKREKYYELLLKRYDEFTQYEDENYCISTCSLFPRTSILKKEWFNGTVNMEFEDVTIKMPVGYDEYLTYVYGNYMQEPPKEKRIPTHKRFYVNFDQGLSINQAMAIIRGNH